MFRKPISFLSILAAGAVFTFASHAPSHAQTTVYNWNPVPGGTLVTAYTSYSNISICRNYMEYVNPDGSRTPVSSVGFRMPGGVFGSFPIRTVSYDTVIISGAQIPHVRVTADGFLGIKAVHLVAEAWLRSANNSGSARYTLALASSPTVVIYDSNYLNAGQVYIKPEN